MALNSPITKLDPGQIPGRVFQVDSDAIRVVMPAGTDFELALDSSEDSIQTIGQSDSGTVVVTSATPTGSLVELVCDGHAAVQVFVKTETTITGPQALTVEVSPIESGDFWVASTLTITPDATAGVTKMSATGSFVAKRVRVTCSVQIAAGSFTLVLAVRG